MSETPEPKPGRNKLGERLAPGIWTDANGDLHFSLPELLALFDLPDTPENRAIATENIKAMMLKENPDVEIVERESPQD